MGEKQYKSSLEQRNYMKLWQERNREYRTEYHRNYRKTKNGKLATYRARDKYELLHPERRRAWREAAKIENKPCEVCGVFPSHRHHPDVSQPLNIVFLCPLHHRQIHLS